MDVTWTGVLGVLGAAVPGVLVALVGHALSQRRERAREARLAALTRSVLGLEVSANLADLRAFWETINALDPDRQQKGAEAHLAAMAQAGLLGYTLPTWHREHWTRLPVYAADALQPQEAEKVFALYSQIDAISALYAKLVTIPPEEMRQYSEGGSGQRFWYNYFASSHAVYLERLAPLVGQALAAGNPLTQGV
jgi:hypothetical protein